MKKLYQGFVAITTPTALVTAYKNPVSIEDILLCNVTASAVTVSLHICESTAGVTASNAIYYNYEVDGNVTDETKNIVVPRGHSLFAIAGTESALVAVITGS